MEFNKSTELSYAPIAEAGDIRLVFIQPAPSVDDPIVCRLEVLKRFNAQPGHQGDAPLQPYRTFSYYWGPTHKDGSHLTHEICCDGTQIRVSSTLFSALLRIRQVIPDSELELGLWIDALCINQQDPLERSAQVGQMWEIYKFAEMVIIWLGEPSSELYAAPGWHKLLFEALERPRKIEDEAQNKVALQRRSRLRSNNRCRYEPDVSLSYDGIHEEARRKVRDKTGHEESQLIREIITLQWFHRRWIIQEALFSRNEVVLYGDCRFSLIRLFPAATLFQIGDQAVPPVLANVSNNYRDNRFLRIMHEFDRHECLDDRDRVYSLMRLSDDFYIQPDYTASTESVYTNTARSLAKNGDLEALLAMASCRKADGQMPSWVPDWRQQPVFVSKAHSDAVTWVLKESSRKTNAMLEIKEGVIVASCFACPACKACSCVCQRGKCLVCDLLHRMSRFRQSHETRTDFWYGETTDNGYRNMEKRRKEILDLYDESIDTLAKEARVTGSDDTETLVCVFGSRHAVFVMKKRQTIRELDQTDPEVDVWAPHCCISPVGHFVLKDFEMYGMTSVVIG